MEIDPDAEAATSTFGCHPFAGLRQSHALEPAQDSANQSAPCRTPLSGTGIVAAEWRGMTDSQMVGPGSGQVPATEVEVPGAGWP